MRWEQLFADLDAQFAAMADAEMMSEIADRQRVAVGAVTVMQRCSGNLGRSIRVHMVSGSPVAGTLRDIGPDWLLMSEGGSASVVIPSGAVTAIEGLGPHAGAPLGDAARRIDFRRALRGIARDRSAVQVVLRGQSGTGTAAHITGTIDRVGADFVEIAQHPAWELRRAATVHGVAVVALDGIIRVHARPVG